jgi:hypothetical protein
MSGPPNSETSGVRAGWLILAAGVALLLGPSLAGMDMMGGGYALGFIGIVVAATGLVTLWIYGARAAALDRILSGAGLLAHWTYDPEEAQRHALEEFEDNRRTNRNLFLVVAVMFVVVGAIVFSGPLLQGEDLGLLLALYFGLVPLLGLVAWATPRLAYRRALQAGADVYIGQDGVYVRGALHTWKQPFSRLKRVRLELDRVQPALQFDIRYLTRLGLLHYETRTVQVPVPRGQERQAEEVARFFAAR